MLLGDAIGVGAALRLVRKMDPAEFLERRLERGEIAVAVDRLIGGLVVGEGEAVAQRHEIRTAGAFHLDREADEVVFGLIHIHADQAHALAAPQLDAETRGLLGIDEISYEPLLPCDGK